MITMIVGEIANFVAYIYAPVVLVTPLGALSIIVSTVFAHFLLNKKHQKMGMLGCLLCIVASTIIVLHAPREMSLTSVQEIWELAIQPGNSLHQLSSMKCLCQYDYWVFPHYCFLFWHPTFLLYTASAIAVALLLVLYCAPRFGPTNILVYIGIYSVIGSLTS